MITVNSRKFDRSISRSWHCDLIHRDEHTLVLKGVFQNDVIHPDLGNIEKGTVSIEYFWFDRWFNAFKFLRPDGELRNFYCNIAMPPTFDGNVLDYVDLDIDIAVWPDMSYCVLDEVDFEMNCERWNYPDALREEVPRTLMYLITRIKAGEFPFWKDQAA